MDRERRHTARVVPVSRSGRVLLLQGTEPTRPDRPYWFSIGGGVDAGETPRSAAVRELREETGIECREDDLVGPFHHGLHDFTYAGAERRFRSEFFALLVDEVVVHVAGSPEERLTASAWWSPDQVRALVLSNPALADVVALAVAVARECGHVR